VVRERYGAGLTPLREALFQLMAEGLVTMEDQRGFRVAEVSQEDLTDLTEQRVFIEGQALRLAIERGDLAWESRVLAAHHRLAGTPMLEPGTTALTDAWSAAHRDFHRVLVEACGSAWLLRFRDVLSDQTERYRRLSARKKPGRDVAAEHRRIAEATLARATDEAVECLAAHYRLTAQLCDLPKAD
jgi:DNA-binding GntR family transcriptional regulator